MFLDASYVIFEQAKALRNSATNAEAKLWAYLRTKPLGHKFRRQHPVSTFILDFYCHALKLVIEVDGNVHAEKIVAQYDTDRQKYLESQELNFLRFTNEQVLTELDIVIATIEKYIIEKWRSEDRQVIKESPFRAMSFS